MFKLIKSDAAIIAVLTLLLFAFVKFQDVSAATLTSANPAGATVLTETDAAL